MVAKTSAHLLLQMELEAAMQRPMKSAAPDWEELSEALTLGWRLRRMTSNSSPASTAPSISSVESSLVETRRGLRAALADAMRAQPRLGGSASGPLASSRRGMSRRGGAPNLEVHAQV